MIKEKLVWIDNLKGLAIIAVVLGHIASPLSKFIYAWHIPLFFFVSGLLINKDRSIKDSIKRDFSRLMIPFYAFSLIGLMAEYLKRLLLSAYPFINGKIILLDELAGIFWWMDFSRLHHYGFVLWFLPSLFWSKNIYLFLNRSLKNKYIVSFLSLFALLYISSQPWILPLGLDKALIGLFWLSTHWILTGRFWEISLLAMLLLPIPTTNIAVKIIDWYGIIYGLIAINTLIGVAKQIPQKVKLFEIFGRETVPVLIIHPYINNLAYLLVVIFLSGDWLLEMVFVLTMLIMVVRNLESTKMVLRYVWNNNNPLNIPGILIRSGIVIIFQSVTRITLTRNLKMGRKIYLFPGSVISRMFLYTDTPDKKEIDLLRKNIDYKSVFLDIGANIGSHSVLLSDLTKNIYAFEPSPISNRQCKMNFSLNNLNKNKVIKIAISDKRGSYGFSDFGGSSSVNHLTEGDDAKIKVKTDSLDNWVRDNLLTKFNLVMKIDVEGNEEMVLSGAGNLLKNKTIKFIVLEVLDKKSNVFKMLKSLGYKSGLISGNNYYVKKV